MIRPPHLAFLAGMARARVDYLLIGLMGVNHYAETAAGVFHTEDVDVLIPPSPSALRRASAALVAAGYELRSNGEAVGRIDALLARRIIERRAVISGIHAHGLSVDLVLEARPFSFNQWMQGRRAFRVDRIRVYCGALEMLLAAKAAAARPKDRAFLKIYAAGNAKPKRRS